MASLIVKTFLERIKIDVCILAFDKLLLRAITPDERKKATKVNWRHNVRTKTISLSVNGRQY